MDNYKFVNKDEIVNFVEVHLLGIKKLDKNDLLDLIDAIYDTGLSEGEDSGFKEAWNDEGMNPGDADCAEAAYDDGFSDGYRAGEADGYQTGFDEGANEPTQDILDKAYKEGYEAGCEDCHADAG